jgi:DNA-binding NtrC family response regulator/pSer/pThr/pTyr-binding forkhead associated (FHA) protein
VGLDSGQYANVPPARRALERRRHFPAHLARESRVLDQRRQNRTNIGAVLALLALFGPKQGLRIPLLGKLVVGRGDTADVQLVDAKVSREHCRVQPVQGVTDRAQVEDLSSQNGTYLNGTPIATIETVAPGDELVIGDTLFLVAGSDVDIVNTRYGASTLMLTQQRNTAPILPMSRPAPSATGASAIAKLAQSLSEADNEESAAITLLDAIESELSPRLSTLLMNVRRHDAQHGGSRIIPIATRGQKGMASISQTLLTLTSNQGRGILIEDAHDHRELRGARSVVLQSLRSVMVAPWGTTEGIPQGFIQVERDSTRPFTAANLAWLETVACFATLRFGRREPNVTPSDARPLGESTAYLLALRIAEAAARVDSTVLLLGETGTGKEEMARHIHRLSGRSQGQFLAVNCGAIAEALAESELFGHEKGAFTGASATRLGAFESAEGGTLFLDEIGDLPLALQVKLLRVLQERAVVRVGSTISRSIDVRIIAATHRDLTAEVKAGRFREDLFFRLNILELRLPSLRQRPSDIPLLAQALLERTASRLGLRAPGFTEEALATLSAWDYPGNVRELANLVERILVLRDPKDPSRIDRDDVRAGFGGELRPATSKAEPSGEETLQETVMQVERACIESALRRARGVKSQAARLLGISRPTLDKKIAELGIDIWT